MKQWAAMVAVMVLGAGTSLAAQAQVYHCSSADGKVTLTDKPCQQGQVSKVALEQPVDAATQARAAEADAQRIRAQQAESARKAQERARMAQQPARTRSSGPVSEKNVEACMQWQRKLKMQENLVRPDPKAVQTAKTQVRRYC